MPLLCHKVRNIHTYTHTYTYIHTYIYLYIYKKEIFKLTRNTIHLPQVTSGNINAPTMMIGDKAGEIIAIDYRADNASDLWEEVGNAHPMSNL